VWTISQAENIRGDKIKALALAKECHAMKLELFTNITVNDAIRLAVSNVVKITEKANYDKLANVDEEGSNSNIDEEFFNSANI
jgi:hypothetical protein